MPDWANDPYWSKYWNLAFQTGASMEYEEARARGDYRTMQQTETHWMPLGGNWYSMGQPRQSVDYMEGDGRYQYRPEGPVAGAAGTSAPKATLVTPTFDPKLEANALYGKAMCLFSGGFARIGAGPAPIVGPYINGDIVDFVVSFGVPANPEGDRKIYRIWLDNELAWQSADGGTLPGHGNFASTPFDFVFKPGTLTQSAVSLEHEKFPGDENAYRPMMILEIRNLPWQRFVDMTGKPVPYVACEIGDTSEGVTEPQNGINLGLALQQVAFSPWCGYTSANFEAVNITDVVGAILIKDNFNFVQLCQSITGEYKNIDLLVSDKVWLKDRASNVSPNFIFDRDKIIAGDDALVVARAGATAQRREHELTAIDPDQDYTAVPSLAKIPRDPMIISAAVGKNSTTVPLVIDADTRQALATFSQNYDENARRKINFKAPALAYQIEPGDLFALSNIASGFDNEVFKTISTMHGANWIVDIEGEAILRCAIFHENVPGTAVVVSGDAAGGIRHCYIEGTGTQEWVGHSTQQDSDWPYYYGGYVTSSSYAKINGVPTFVTGGNNLVFLNFGSAIIMVSHDAINWTLAYKVGATDRRAIYNMVWDAADGAFYADTKGPIANGIATPPPPHEPVFCLRSTDGHTWEEVGEWFWDHVEDGKTPDGRAGHDPESGLTIMPGDLSLGKPIHCTAYANGVWLAGGGSSGDSVTYISYDGGVNWEVTTAGGGIGTGMLGAFNAKIVTMIATPLSDITG